MMREMTNKDFIDMTDEKISEAMADEEYFSDMPDEVNAEMSGVDYFGRIIEARISRAKTGDTAAAKELMNDFCGAIKMYTGKATAKHPEWEGRPIRTPDGKGVQIDERILRYFGECFGEILAGNDVEKAMNLKKPACRPKQKLKERDIDLAVMVQEQREIKPTRRKPKKSKDAINSDVATATYNSKKTVEAAFLNNKKLASMVVDMNKDFPSLLTEIDSEDKT